MSEHTPFGRAAEATEEVPLGRPLGRVDEEAQPGREAQSPGPPRGFAVTQEE